jgi:hypothetical protein
MAPLGVRLVGRVYQAAGVLTVLLMLIVAVKVPPDVRGITYLVLVFPGIVAVLLFVLGVGILQSKEWARGACPRWLRGTDALAPPPTDASASGPRRGIRVIAGFFRGFAVLFAFFMLGIPMGVGVGELTPFTAYSLVALFGALSLVSFVVATGLLGSKRWAFDACLLTLVVCSSPYLFVAATLWLQDGSIGGLLFLIPFAAPVLYLLRASVRHEVVATWEGPRLVALPGSLWNEWKGRGGPR